MNRESEQFGGLRRLLALKRHEQPPPGFHQDFSSQVIARLRAGDQGQPENFLDRLMSEAPWLERWWASFSSRPTLAGAFGAGVCALLVSLVVYSENGEPSAVGAVLSSQSNLALGMSTGMPSDPNAFGSSTNPISTAPASLFGQPDLNMNIQPASLVVPAN